MIHTCGTVISMVNTDIEPSRRRSQASEGDSLGTLAVGSAGMIVSSGPEHRCVYGYADQRRRERGQRRSEQRPPARVDGEGQVVAAEIRGSLESGCGSEVRGVYHARHRSALAPCYQRAPAVFHPDLRKRHIVRRLLEELRRAPGARDRVVPRRIAAVVGLGRVDFLYPEIGRATRLNSSHLGISYAVFCL